MKTLSAKSLSMIIFIALIIGVSNVSFADDDIHWVLTPVKQPIVDELAGNTHKLYIEVGGKGWLILFKSAEVAAKNELGNFNGVWLADEKNSTVKVFRFDTEEGVELSLFSSPELKGYVIGYRMTEESPWHFLFPEKTFLENPTITIAALQPRQ